MCLEVIKYNYLHFKLALSYLGNKRVAIENNEMAVMDISKRK